MSIYTNRGLKVRLDTAFVFALIARLAPRYSAFTVFQYVEGIELSSAFFFDFSLILTLWLHPTPLCILFIPPIFATLQMLMKLARAYTPLASLMMPLFRIYAWFHGYGIILVALAISVYLILGFRGIFALLGAYVISSTILHKIENIYAKWWKKHCGRLLWGSEQSFIYAFQYLAHKIGVNARTVVSEEEKENKTTYLAFARLIIDHPKISNRFDDDYITHKLDNTRLSLAILEARATPQKISLLPFFRKLLRVPLILLLICIGFLTSFTIYIIPIGLFLSWAPVWIFRLPFPLELLTFIFINSTLYLCIFRPIFIRIAPHPFAFQYFFIGHHVCFSFLLGVVATCSLASTLPPMARYLAAYTVPGLNMRFLTSSAIITLLSYCCFFVAHQKSLIPAQFAKKYPKVFN